MAGAVPAGAAAPARVAAPGLPILLWENLNMRHMPKLEDTARVDGDAIPRSFFSRTRARPLHSLGSHRGKRVSQASVASFRNIPRRMSTQDATCPMLRKLRVQNLEVRNEDYKIRIKLPCACDGKHRHRSPPAQPHDCTTRLHLTTPPQDATTRCKHKTHHTHRPDSTSRLAHGVRPRRAGPRRW